ncbi:MAG: hypothetical protein M3R13_04810 [Armatimonadota bacterium]|nr:hypothetical protein [Armatimonadota bacterium]
MAAVSAASLGVPALPQFTLLGDGGSAGSPVELRGKPAVDLIPGVRRGLGYPLRNDNIVPGSAEVFLGGRKLALNEFSVDFTSGVLYVSANVQESDSIRVIYRHDPDAQTSANKLGALPLMTLNFGGGGTMTMLMGIGGADRENGRVMQSNNLGFKSSFSLGKASVSGLFMRSSKENAFVEGDSASPDDGSVEKGESSSGTLVKQNANIDVGGGMNISADYQDVDSSFTGFGMLASSGLAENEIKQLEKEKGITRMGLGFNGGNAKSVLFNNSYRTIDDGVGKIQFHDYGFKTGFAEAYYSSRDIEAGFSRFKDLAEGDREQFQKERGISRQKLGGAFNFGGAKLSFDRNLISQEEAGIERELFGFESNFLKGSFRSQRIDQNFSRTGDLSEAEREQWGRERGMSRKEVDFSLPRGDKSLASFSNKTIRYDGRIFDAQSFGFATSAFGVKFWNRSTDESFQRLGDLSKAELTEMALNVLSIYDPAAQVREVDWQWAAREAGISRNFMKFDATPIKGGALSYSTVGIDAKDGGLDRSVFDVSYGNFKFGYRSTNIDSGFNRTFDLLEIERNIYGNQIGFDRSEWNTSAKFGRALDFSMENLAIQEGANRLNRFKGSLKGKGIELQGAMRDVDANFLRTLDVNDPERDLFTQLIGYREQDLTLKFDAIKGVKLNGLFFDANNGMEDKHRFRHEAGLLLNPDSKTEVEFSYRDHKFQGLKDTLFENSLMRMRGTRDIGRLGKLTLMHETEEYGGKEATNPSRNTNYLKYETKIGNGFDFMTEQGITAFNDGGFENYQGYKIGWQVNKRLGVNLEQVFVDRDSKKADNQSTNFGFSYDFGSNLKVGYTFKEDMNSVVGGKMASRWEMTQGTLGGFTMGGSYAETGQTGMVDSFLGNFNLSNPKPFSLGFLKNVKISLGYDGKNEIGVWQNEKRLGDFSANVFGSEVGLNYSQVMLPGAVIAVDRVARISLDPTGKKPFQLGMAYKVRTLPNGQNYVIRDIDASYKVGENLSVSHSTDDLPEEKQNNAVFGTNVKPTLGRKWAIDYRANKSTKAQFGYEEFSDLGHGTLLRRANVTMSFFENSGSPVRLTYAMEQNDRPIDGRRSRNEYKVAFDQKPGNNQTLSLMLGMVDWTDGLPEGELWNRALFSLDYQLRF